MLAALSPVYVGLLRRREILPPAQLWPLMNESYDIG
jgi:hypothetical protein